jgi:hypothetical protein
MNRDFEIRQLLRALRSGIMSEAAFEEEMSRLELESTGHGHGMPASFEAGGRSYSSEREAVLSFLDELHATHLDFAIGFAKWGAICRTNGLRTGLLIAAERDAYHARVIERRMHELGGELRSAAGVQGGKLIEILANSAISDFDKLSAFTALIQEPQQAVAPLLGFAQALNRDLETKQALRLIAEDELSTTTWLHAVCAALASSRADSINSLPPETPPESTPSLPGTRE